MDRLWNSISVVGIATVVAAVFTVLSYLRPSEVIIHNDSIEQLQSALAPFSVEGDSFAPPELSGLINNCSGSAAHTIDADQDGTLDTIRGFGTAVVRAKAYDKLGRNEISLQSQNAELKAKAAITRHLDELVTSVRRNVEKRSSQQGSLELSEKSQAEIVAISQKSLRKVTTAEMSVLTYGDGDRCVFVAVDAPIDENA